MRAARSTMPATSPPTPRNGAIGASGWRSITTWRASPAPRPRSCSASRRRDEDDSGRRGRIMLPNHAPNVIAEQFGTLARLFPAASILASAARRAPISSRCAPCAAAGGGRELSAGRSGVPGVPRAGGRASASRRCRRRERKCRLDPRIEPFRRDAGRRTGAALRVRLAFRARPLIAALEIYRERFKPSEQLDRPYAMVGVNIVAAETDDEARRLATTQQMSFTNIFRGARGRASRRSTTSRTIGRRWKRRRRWGCWRAHRRLAGHRPRRHGRAGRGDPRRRTDRRLRFYDHPRGCDPSS